MRGRSHKTMTCMVMYVTLRAHVHVVAREVDATIKDSSPVG